MLIRLAHPDAGAETVADIYRPVVEETAISFEEVAPSTEEMARRMARTLQTSPWLVAEVGGVVVGYAYAATHRERAAYRWAIDVSAYVGAEWRGRGVGRALYDRLLGVLQQQGYFNVYAGITLPNDASLSLHRAVGMEPIGIYRRIGYKLGEWWDVMWLGRRLRDDPDPVADPVPLPHLLTGRTG
jgi:phosphinothricin acetyltransferase